MISKDQQLEGIRAFVFEAGELRRERDNGFHHIHADPSSVAEHCHRGSVLAFVLASYAKQHEIGYEDVDPNYVVSLVTFHDLHEGRTGDDDLIQKRYVKIDADLAIKEQTQGLGMIGETIRTMWQEVETGSTPAGRLAKDCEILERAFTARELVFYGNSEAQAWIDAVAARLKTNSAKELIKTLDGADPNEWWKRTLGYPITTKSNGGAEAPR
jgi:5'-deoxynucleotidase YfbR-like HD superfamily hydrolase